MTPDPTDPARRDGAAEAMVREWDAAVEDEAVEQVLTLGSLCSHEAQVAHMAALLTTVRAQARAVERERCAQIAEARSFYPDTHTGMRQQWVKEQIAATIRALPTDAPGVADVPPPPVVPGCPVCGTNGYVIPTTSPKGAWYCNRAHPGTGFGRYFNPTDAPGDDGPDGRRRG